MTKIGGSGSEYESGFISQRLGSTDPDPDPHQNVMDPQHWLKLVACFQKVDLVVRDTGGGKKTTTLTLRSPGKIQSKDSIRSGLCLGLVQVWSRFSPARLVQGLVQVRTRILSRSRTGSVLDWSRSNPGPVPVRVQARSRSVSRSGPGPIQVRFLYNSFWR